MKSMCVVFVCLLTLSSLALAKTGSATEHTLTLEKVLSMIETHYPPMLAAALEKNIAEGEWLAAEGGFDLNLRARGAWRPIGFYQFERLDTIIEQPTTLWGTSLYGGWRIGRGNYPDYYGEHQTGSMGEARAGIQIPLLRDGSTDRRRATLRRAALGTRIADNLIAGRLLELRRAATRAYWTWVVAAERQRIPRALLSIAEARDGGIVARVKAGDLPAIEHTDNQRTVMERRARLIEADRRLQQAGNELSLWVRDAHNKPISIRPEHLPTGLPVVEHDTLFRNSKLTSLQATLVQLALKRRPEVERFQRALAQLDVESSFAKNQILPRLDIAAGVSKDMGQVDATRAPTDVEASVLLEIPLQLRAARGRAIAVQAQRDRLALEQTFLKERIATEVRDALIALEATKHRIMVARQAVRLAEALEKAERASFELGNSTILIVNLREQASADAQLVAVEAVGDYLFARADYAYAVGDRR